MTTRNIIKDTSNDEDGKRGAKTSWAQRQAILLWLQTKANFNLVEGKATDGLSTVVAGQKLKKKDGFKMLGDFVYSKCSSEEHWTAVKAAARYKSYKLLYRTTLYAWKDTTGKKFGLSDDDFSKGIDTIDKKLEVLCPGFFEMDKLFGDRQNINPTHILTNDEDEIGTNSQSSLTESLNEYSESQNDNDFDLDGDDDVDDDTDIDIEDEIEDEDKVIEDSQAPINNQQTDVVLLRHENGPPEFLFPGSGSSHSVSSLSVNTGVVLNPPAASSKRGRKPKATQSNVPSVQVDPVLAEAAAKLVADAEGNRQVLVGPNKTTGKNDSFTARWSEAKIKSIELEGKKWEWDKEMKRTEFLITSDREKRRMVIEEEELNLKKTKFEFEKENNSNVLKLELEDKDKGRKDDMRKSVMLELIKAGKSAEEVRQYLTELF